VRDIQSVNEGKISFRLQKTLSSSVVNLIVLLHTLASDSSLSFCYGEYVHDMIVRIMRKACYSYYQNDIQGFVYKFIHLINLE